MWLPYSALLDYWREGEELSSLPLTLAANMPKIHQLQPLPACHYNSWPTITSPRTKTVCLFGTIIVGCYRHIVTTHSCWLVLQHCPTKRREHDQYRKSLTLGLLADYQHWYDDESKETCSLHPDLTQFHSLTAYMPAAKSARLPSTLYWD